MTKYQKLTWPSLLWYYAAVSWNGKSMNPKSIIKGATLITGGAKRIGKAICLDLAESGYQIALHYNHSKSEAKNLAELIQKKGVQCETFACDLADERQTLQLIERVHQQFPNLNLLINNASVFQKSNLRTTEMAIFNQDIAINLKAPYILMRDFAKICRKGDIINILDTNIIKNKTAHLSYLLAKKTLGELTKLSAVELAPQIRVNGIAPGLILPPVEKRDTYLTRLTQKIPLKKKGHPHQITQSIRFLLDNSYITGQIIYVDGGEHLI